MATLDVKAAVVAAARTWLHSFGAPTNRETEIAAEAVVDAVPSDPQGAYFVSVGDGGVDVGRGGRARGHRAETRSSR